MVGLDFAVSDIGGNLVARCWRGKLPALDQNGRNAGRSIGTAGGNLLATARAAFSSVSCAIFWASIMNAIAMRLEDRN